MFAWSRLALLTLSAALACTRVPAVGPQAELESPVAAPTVVVEGPSVAPTCVARTPSGALLLIPDTAEWMFQIGPRALLRSPAYGLVAAQFEQAPEWAKLIDVLRPCGVSLEHIDHVVVGLDAAQNFVGIVIAPGIGRPEVSRCVMQQVQVQAGSKPEVADVQPVPGDAGASMMQFSDGRAYMFGDDMFTLATTGWQDALLELSNCRAAPAAYGSLATPLRGLDLDATLWVAASPPTQMLAPLGASLGVDVNGVTSFGASLRLDDGAALVTRVQTRDDATASSLAQTLRTFVQVATVSPPPELAALPSRIVVDSVGSELLFDATLRFEELRFMASQNP